MNAKTFFKNVAAGAAIGTGMIIPGVSGGTIAVLLNIYDGIIDSINGLRKHFKASVLFLLPVLLGVVAAFAAMYFPIKYALEYAPLPTVIFFAALMVGGLPKLIKDGVKKGFKPINALSCVLPLALVVGICFIPSIGLADLSPAMPVWGYFALIGIGVLGSCALVVPGVSGSMMLLILGYYGPILNTVSALKVSFGHSVLVLFLFVLGVIIGFFTISKLMKLFLTRFPRGTYWAIISFVVGSIAAIFISFGANFPEAPPVDALQISLSVVLGVVGAVGAFLLTLLAEKKSEEKSQNQ